MSHHTIREQGQERLQRLKSGEEAVEQWKAFLAAYSFRPEQPDDASAWLTCTLALEAVASDNFGVGALLVDDNGQVVAQGHNQVFHPHFRSDRHAEMVVLEGWENDHAGQPARGEFTLYSSLEPCPMCLIRLCHCPTVRRVLFAAPDDMGGMVQRLDSLPPVWRELALGKTFARARCSDELVHAASGIWQINLAELNGRLQGNL
jgi:cytosine deaminase